MKLETIPSLLAVALAFAVPLSAAVVFDAPGHAAIEGREVAASGGEPGAAWTLVDWLGREKGVSGVFDAEGRATLPPLPAGYYRLQGESRIPNPESRRSATLATLAVVTPPSLVTRHSSLVTNESAQAGSFYAVDTALSWISRPGAFLCPWNDGDTLRTVADLVRLAGFRHVRERLKWNEVQPSRDVPPDFSRYVANAELFRERGAAVSGMFHDAPVWAGAAAPHDSVPGDLGAVFRFCRDAASAFGDRMGDWEFWNEEDIHFAKEPVWEYVAAMKAAYLGFKAAKPEMPVLCGALCQMPSRCPYQRIFFDNDAALYFDVFNYHTYLPIAKYPAAFGAIREDLCRVGAADRPIWVTEFGTNLEGHSDNDGAKKGMKAHSPEQETVHAEFYPKAQIAMQAEGVERAFFFVFAAFNERSGRKDWGVIRRDGTVKPVFAAMAAMNRELGAAKFLGPIDAPEGIRAYLYGQPDGSQTVAFWSESPIDTSSSNIVVSPEPDYAREWTIRFGITAPLRLVDMCGAQAPLDPPNPDGTLSLVATRFPAYLSGLRGLEPCGDAARGSRKEDSPRPFPSPVILRPVLDSADFAITGGKTLAIMKGDTGKIRLQIWNLSGAAATGNVEVAGVVLEGLPASPIEIPPFDKAEFACVLVAESSTSGGDWSHRSTLVLSGAFDGSPVSRAAIPLFFEKPFLASCVRQPLEWRDTARWERNSSADEENISFDETEGAIRFDASWKDVGDHWVYPVLTIEPSSLSGATRVAFEVKSAQDKVENDFKTSKLMLVGDDGNTDIYLDYDPPTTDWELRYVEIPPALEMDGMSAIRIGANLLGSRCTIWLRDVSILK